MKNELTKHTYICSFDLQDHLNYFFFFSSLAFMIYPALDLLAFKISDPFLEVWRRKKKERKETSRK